MSMTHQGPPTRYSRCRHAALRSWAYSSHVGRVDATPNRCTSPTRGSTKPMPVLPTTIDPNSDSFRVNERALREGLELVDAELATARAGGGERYVARHRERGKLTARERIELLLDRDSPFLELCPFAAWGTQYTVGASSIMGVGVVEGVEVLVNATDPTVRGGAMNPWSFRKGARGSDIALANRLPSVSLTESGGADLPAQAELFIPGGRAFRDITRHSAAAIPTVSLVFGNATAGGAYVPGLSLIHISEPTRQ